MIAVILLIAAQGLNSTAFTYRDLHPAGLFPYERAVAECPVTGAFTGSSYLADAGPLHAAMSFSRPYSMEELHAGTAQVGGRAGNTGFTLIWTRFGAGGYTEDVLGAGAGVSFNGFLRIGGRAELSRLSIETEELNFTTTVADFSASAVASPFRWLDLGGLLENARSYFQQEGRDLHHPGWSAGIALKPARGIALTWNINETHFGTINTFAVSANLLENFSLRGGWSRETHSLAGAVVLILNNMMISYGLRHHGYLGATHHFGVAVSTSLPRMDELSYDVRRFRRAFPDLSAPVADLKTCTAEELRAATGMGLPESERIVKYREMFGPLSRKALTQMGLTGQELKAMEGRLKNIAPDNARPKWEPKYGKGKKIRRKTDLPFYTREKRKKLFQNLVAGGVKAGSALRLAEMARDLERIKLVKHIGGLSFLSDEEKKAARRICSAR